MASISKDVFEAVTSQLFVELKQVYKETGKVTDEILSALSNVFQATLLPALDLVDNRSVSLLVCPAGRQLYQVVGSSGTPYTCFKGNNYCSCPAYRFSVLNKEELTMLNCRKKLIEAGHQWCKKGSMMRMVGADMAESATLGSCPDSSCCGIPIETLVTGFLNECKHVLAVKLSDAMEITKRLEVTDRELTDLLINLE